MDEKNSDPIIVRTLTDNKQNTLGAQPLLQYNGCLLLRLLLLSPNISRRVQKRRLRVVFNIAKLARVCGNEFGLPNLASFRHFLGGDIAPTLLRYSRFVGNGHKHLIWQQILPRVSVKDLKISQGFTYIHVVVENGPPKCEVQPYGRTSSKVPKIIKIPPTYEPPSLH